MRRKARLTSPNHIDRQLVIEDFSKFTKNSNWLLATDKGIKPGCGTISFASCTYNNARQLFSVRDRVFLYLTSGVFYEFKNGYKWSQILTTKKRPTMVSVNISGADYDIILGTNSYIYHSNGVLENVDIPFGRGAVEFNKRLFIGDSNKLYFSKYLDSKQTLIDGISYGYVTTEVKYGNILALLPNKDYLVVVCDKAIYHLYMNDDSEVFKLVRQNVDISARDGSIYQINDTIMFCSDTKLFRYENGKIKTIKFGEENKYYGFGAQANVCGNAYLALFYDDYSQGYLVYYDVVTERKIFYKTDITIIGNNGYIVNNKKLEMFSEQSSPDLDGFWESVEFDFGSSKPKQLKGIELKSECMTSLELETPCGLHQYNFDPGHTLIKLNVIDTKFKLTVRVMPLEADVQKIKLIYRIQED